MEDKELLTLKQAADYLDFQEGYLKSLIETNDIPYYNPINTVYYFRKCELNEWMCKVKETATKEEVLDKRLKILGEKYSQMAIYYNNMNHTINRYESILHNIECNLVDLAKKHKSDTNNIIWTIILTVAIATVIIKWL